MVWRTLQCGHMITLGHERMYRVLLYIFKSPLLKLLEFFDAAHHAKPIGHALNLSAVQTAHPVTVPTKRFGHVLKIDVSIGRKAKSRRCKMFEVFHAARQAQPTRSLS